MKYQIDLHFEEMQIVKKKKQNDNKNINKKALQSA